MCSFKTRFGGFSFYHQIYCVCALLRNNGASQIKPFTGGGNMPALTGREVEIGDIGPLTPREAEALLWVAEGKTAWEAGTILGISESTANAHITNAAEKLQASNRPNLVTRAFVLGILRVSQKLAVLIFILQMAVTDRSDMTAMRKPARRRREDYCYVINDERRAG